MNNGCEGCKPSSDKYELIWDESGFPIGEIGKVFTSDEKKLSDERRGDPV
jgi:hypothetical protein